MYCINNMIVTPYHSNVHFKSSSVFGWLTLRMWNDLASNGMIFAIVISKEFCTRLCNLHNKKSWKIVFWCVGGLSMGKGVGSPQFFIKLSWRILIIVYAVYRIWMYNDIGGADLDSSRENAVLFPHWMTIPTLKIQLCSKKTTKKTTFK